MKAGIASRSSRRTTRVPTILLLVASAVLAVHTVAPPTPEPLLLVGVRILDTLAGRYLPAAGVLVVGDRITDIFVRLPTNLPAGTRRIDLAGATLVPGLGDMFATAAPDGSADADFYYAMALAHGVTSYRVVGGRLPWAASQRERVKAGEIVAPRLWIGGPRFDQQAPPSFSTRRVADEAAARREVAEQASLGAEWVSVSATTGPDVYRAIVGAARTGGLRVSGEPGATPTGELVRLGVDAIDRLGFWTRGRQDYERELGSRPDYPRTVGDELTDYLWQRAGAADLRPVIPKTARRRVVVIPMLASFNGTLGAEALMQDTALPVLPGRWRQALLARAHPGSWPGAARAAEAAAIRARLARDLVTAGARLVTGVDVESSGYNIPGAGVHRELALLVAAGVSTVDAIRTATLNCAELLGSAGSLGQIKVGFKADLIAVEGDPLARVADLQRIKLIVRGGEVLERDQLLAQARRAVR